MTKYVALNENGRPIGENHHRSTISDETVDLIRELHEDEGISTIRIALRLKLNKETVRKICNYERRAQTAFGHKRIT